MKQARLQGQMPKASPGRFELADGGTLFLDEVSNMSPVLQVKLQRALQDQEIERLGGTRPLKVDVRIIAATNQDLAEEVRLGKFREDLYYRFNLLSINLPPLRERAADIPLLVDHFLQAASIEAWAKRSEGFRRAVWNSYNSTIGPEMCGS